MATVPVTGRLSPQEDAHLTQTANDAMADYLKWKSIRNPSSPALTGAQTGDVPAGATGTPTGRVPGTPSSTGSITGGALNAPSGTTPEGYQKLGTQAAWGALNNGWMSSTPRLVDPDRKITDVTVGDSFGYADGKASVMTPKAGQKAAGQFGGFEKQNLSAPNLGSTNLSQTITRGLGNMANTTPTGQFNPVQSRGTFQQAYTPPVKAPDLIPVSRTDTPSMRYPLQYISDEQPQGGLEVPQRMNSSQQKIMDGLGSEFLVSEMQPYPTTPAPATPVNPSSGTGFDAIFNQAAALGNQRIPQGVAQQMNAPKVGADTNVLSGWSPQLSGNADVTSGRDRQMVGNADVLSGWSPQMANQNGASSITDLSGKIDAATTPLKDREGYYSQFMNGLEGGKASGYSNDLEKTAQNKIVQNMNRSLPEGFDTQYLKDLSSQGIDPLKDAYDIAMKGASADFNRRGLAASGFEDEAKFGTQDNSITSAFLKNAANVSRDVNLQAANAKREDTYRNAGLQDQATNSAVNLSQSQNTNNLTRSNADINKQMQEKSLLAQGLGLSTDAELKNKDLAMQGVAALGQNQGARDSSNISWAGQNLNAINANNAANSDYANLGLSQFGQNMNAANANNAASVDFAKLGLDQFGQNLNAANANNSAMSDYSKLGLEQAGQNSDNKYRYDQLGTEVDQANEANRLAYLKNDQDAQAQGWGQTRDSVGMQADIQKQLNQTLLDNAKFQTDTDFGNQDMALKYLQNSQGANQQNFDQYAKTADMMAKFTGQDNDAALAKAKLEGDFAQQNDSNRLDWAEFGNKQIQQDNQTAQQDYQNIDSLTKYLINRNDSEQMRQENKDISLQTDNLGLNQQTFNNLMAFATGQQPTINANNQTAQAAQQAQAARDAEHAASKQKTGLNWFANAATSAIPFIKGS